MFQPQRMRVSGDHDGYTRVATFDHANDATASPGQIMVPATKVNFSNLTNRTYIRILGKCY